MHKLLKESEYFLAWLVFWACATVGGFILGALSGALLGFLMGMSGVSVTIIRVVCGAVGFLWSVVLSYVFFRIFVSLMVVKKIQNRIQEMPPPPPTSNQTVSGGTPA